MKNNYNIESKVIFDKREESDVPNISVIVPVYNAEKYLKSCLGSLQCQKNCTAEFICVNDGSEDKSLEILIQYAKNDYRFVVISQSNSGQGVARNTGIAYSRGEYVYFLDSDDSIKENALFIMYKQCIDNDLEVLLFNTDPIYESKQIEREYSYYSDYYKRNHSYDGVMSGIEIITKMKENNEYIVSPCLYCTKRNYIINHKLRFIPSIIHEDYCYTFECLYFAGKTGYIQNKLHNRLVRTNSTTICKKNHSHAYGYFVSYMYMLDFAKSENKSLVNDKIKDEGKYSKIILNTINNIARHCFRIYNNLDFNEQKEFLNKLRNRQIEFINMVISIENNEIEKYKSKRNQLEQRNCKLELKVEKLNSDLASVKNSLSYKIGRAITMIPRKINGYFVSHQD